MVNKVSHSEIIAVFDFDGTITSRDSFVDFIISIFGSYRFIKGLFLLSPILLLNRLKIISNHDAKERLFAYFFSGQTKDNFSNLCYEYSLNSLPNIIRKEALTKIDWHKKYNHRLVIVSASLDSWILPWALRAGFDDVIGTIPDINNDIVTGKFKTKNCNGKEKVRRFLEKYPYRDKYFLYTYGDSVSDKEILEIADKSFFRRF